MKNENLQPKILRGYVRSERIKCGKPNCRCAKGALHGEYFYRYEWRKGRRVKFYVKREDAPDVIAACSLWRDEAKKQRKRSRITLSVLREAIEFLQESESILQLYKTFRRARGGGNEEQI